MRVARRMRFEGAEFVSEECEDEVNKPLVKAQAFTDSHLLIMRWLAAAAGSFHLVQKTLTLKPHRTPNSNSNST